MQELVIESGRAERQYWRDLWHYRELFYFLAWRDLLVRYKQTVVGLAWSFIRPALAVFLLTLFGKAAKLHMGNVPGALFTSCALLPWQFFSTAMAESGSSLVNNANMISKVYFPRLVVPASSVITSFVDFLITGVLVALLMVWYRFLPPATFWLLPIFILLVFAASFGAGLWIAALMVKYRDFRFIVPFIVQYGFIASPLVLATNDVPLHWRLVWSLNPMVGIIDGFRWCLLGGQNVMYWPGFAVSTFSVLCLIMTGFWYFRKTERTFADVI
ncbi:MAG: ABC transporter permease [Verrucomicrobiota bacterium]|jgi:lipopolysaccharide transport system permease protein